MALQKQNISLNLGNGMDQKTDNKIGPDNQFAEMMDWIYKKVGKLYKRFGTDKLSNTIVTDYPNPLSIGTSDIPSSSFAYKDQLLMQNKGALYSYSEDQTNWYFKGHHYPLEVETKTSVASELQYEMPTAYSAGNLRIIVYRAYDFNSVTIDYKLKYTVIENNTGNILIDDSLIASLSSSDIYWQIISFASRTYLLYQEGANLKIAEFNLATGVLGAFTNLKTNLKASQSFPDGNQSIAFSFVMTNKVGIGERAIISYCNTSSFLTLFALQNDGTIDSTMGTLTTALSMWTGCSINYNTVTDILFVLYAPTTLLVKAQTFTFTGSGFTAVTAITVYSNYYTTFTFDIHPDPVNTSQMLVAFNQYHSNYYTTTIVEPQLFFAVINGTSVVTTPYLVGSGYVLSARSYTDTNRTTVYSFIVNTTGTQRTNFMIDRLKGKNEAALFVQSKWNYGVGYWAGNNQCLSQVSVINSQIYLALSKIIDFVGSPSTTATTTPILFERTGVSENFIELEPQQSGSYAFLGDAVHTSGGYLGYYDGSNFVESSYFLNPEFIQAQIINNANPRNTIVVTQQGTAGLPEKTEVTFFNGAAQLASSITQYYWTFTTTVSTCVVYYVKDGVGIVPTIAGTKIGVNISSGDTASAVCAKTYEAILNAGVPVILTIMGTHNETLEIVNAFNGIVADASNTNYKGPTIVPSGVDTGTYQYVAVWTYFDVNGQVIKSAPSIPVSVTATAGDYVALACLNPLLTNRNVSSVRTEWYRTKANQTVFYKASNLNEDKVWILNNTGAGFLDNKSDNSLAASPELLYTEGGILENYQIPQVKQLSVFKNRIIATGVDDPTVLYYSKTNIYGAPVEFSAELFVQVDIDSDPITGHAQLDDKLIIFKEKKVYYMAGDGANDLGQGSSFSLPTLIATDCGCISHNSITKTPLGLMFKSQKGIYILDRSLQLTYIGKEVEDYNSEIVMKGVLLPEDNQVRFTLKSQNTLVYDYLFNRWTAFSQYGGDGAVIWQDQYTRIDNTGRTYVENKSLWIDSGSAIESYSPTFQTKWLQVKDIQDYARIYRLAILGDLKSPHTLNYKIYYDYDVTNFDEYNFASSNISGVQYDDSVYQPVIHLKRQKCDSMMVVITVIADGDSEESLELVDMSFTVGLKQGLQKVKADKKL